MEKDKLDLGLITEEEYNQRKEELVKVGIHELIHCLRFDIKYYPTDLVKMYYDNFCIEVNNCNFDDYFNCSNLIFFCKSLFLS